MLINLTDVFSSEGSVRKISAAYEGSHFSYRGNAYPVADDSKVTLTLTNAGPGRALIEGELKAALTIPCDRCLRDVEISITAALSHQAVSPEGRQEQAGREEDQSFISGYELDVNALMNNEILINMPAKVLCSKDCRGICTVCGQNLNEGECGCDRFVPEPRMAAIKDIFYANKEV